jgi:hypothetical protein
LVHVTPSVLVVPWAADEERGGGVEAVAEGEFAGALTVAPRMAEAVQAMPSELERITPLPQVLLLGVTPRRNLLFT